jgi:hypothetical protein
MIFSFHSFGKKDGDMGAHWVVGYLGVVGYYDHAHHVRVVVLGEVQRPIGVCPKLTTSLDELVEKHPQRLE